MTKDDGKRFIPFGPNVQTQETIPVHTFLFVQIDRTGTNFTLTEHKVVSIQILELNVQIFILTNFNSMTSIHKIHSWLGKLPY